MNEKSLNFDDEKIDKNNLYKNKKPFIVSDRDANKISISIKEPYGKKSSFRYFIGYDNDDYFGPLCIKLPQMIGMLSTLMVIRQCLLRLRLESY